MENLGKTIAQNLNRLRLERGLSLGKLADLCGISKVLLSQIEKGNNNPTIQTIWKIAGGLNVPYTALIDAPREECRVVTRAEAQAHSQFAPDPRCTISCYYRLTTNRNFEVFGIRIEPGGAYVSPSHPENSVEYLFAQEGMLSVRLAGKEHILGPGDSLTFPAAQEHEYRNTCDTAVSALCINCYSP